MTLRKSIYAASLSLFPLLSLLAPVVLSSCDNDKDLNVVEIPVTPYDIPALWMVGNATAADWNIDAPVEMTKVADNTFEYVGHLNEGEFKCPMEPGNWGGAFIMPQIGGTIISSAGVESPDISLMPNGNPDNKWNVTESGEYRILIDGNKHKIEVTSLN